MVINMKGVSSYLLIKCKCENEQIVFGNSTQKVECMKCSEVLVQPTGGRAAIFGKIVKELS